MTEPKPKTPRPLDGLNRIGKYEVLTDTVGAGGFCCVYPCQYNSPSTARVAIKVSLLSVEDCENDIKVMFRMAMFQLLPAKLSNKTAMHCSGLHTRGSGRYIRAWPLAGHRLVNALAFQPCMNVSQNAQTSTGCLMSDQALK